MNDALITIQVVLAMPDSQQLCEFDVPAGTTARQAALLSVNQGLSVQAAGIDINLVPLGVYAERVEDDHVLQHQDRVELYRPLQQDPKELRRRRARKV